MRLEVIAGSHQHRCIERDGVWERHIGAFIAGLLPRLPSPVVFDVGANVGYYTVLAAEVGARVVAFEPNPGVRQILTRNVASSACSGVTIDPRIVGASGW